MGSHTAESATENAIVLPHDKKPDDFGYMRLDWLAKYVNPANPKDHDVGEIMQSIIRHGFVGAVTIDQSSGVVVAGHGRIKALNAMLLDGYDPPERIALADDEMWLVPTHVKYFADETERNAYTVGDNQTTISGGWEEAKLVEMLASLHESDPVGGLKGTGFDGDDLDHLVAMLAGSGGESTTEGYGGGEKVEQQDFGIIVRCNDSETEQSLQALLTEHGYKAKRLSDGGG